MAERQTLVSVDLDDLACYHGIHGLVSPPRPTASVVLHRCLPRFLELFAELGVRATFFVIGRDLARDLREGGRGAELLRQAVADGHELGNHSHAHAYDMMRWPPGAVRSDLEACDLLLRELGADVRGFRAPGYTHDLGLLEQVRRMGYAYDSSCLPSPLYWCAKATVIVALALRGRRSVSMLGGARSFFGPRVPYRRDALDLWELPISVAGVAAVPLIGTTLLCTAEPVARRLARAARALEYFHLELHGLDLADPGGDGYASELVRRQPELRRSLAEKRSRLARLLRDRGPTTRLADCVAER